VVLVCCALHCHYFKWIVPCLIGLAQPKRKTKCQHYSPLCHSKLVFVSFFCGMQKGRFWECSVSLIESECFKFRKTLQFFLPQTSDSLSHLNPLRAKLIPPHVQTSWPHLCFSFIGWNCKPIIFLSALRTCFSK